MVYHSSNGKVVGAKGKKKKKTTKAMEGSYCDCTESHHENLPSILFLNPAFVKRPTSF